MNYLQKKKLAFMSIVNQIKGFIMTISGAFPLTLTDCVDNKSITNYSIHGNSMQDGVPTPGAPIEVESVGEKSPNLINWDYLLENTNITKVDNGYCSKTYFHCFYVNDNLVKQLKTVLKPNINYTLSRFYTGSYSAAAGMITIRGNGVELVNCTYNYGLRFVTFALSQEEIDSINEVYVYAGTDGVIAELQLTESDTVLPYEPYGYKIPITVSSKNLFDEVEASEVDNWDSFSTAGDIANKFIYLPEGTYSISRESVNLPLNANLSFYKYSAEGEIVSYILLNNQFESGVVGNFTLSNGEYVCMILYVPGNNGAIRYIPNLFTKGVSKFLLCEGRHTSATIPPYEPYHEPISTSIYLDEPLRKVGDYADYIDFENGKVIRQVRKMAFNGTENWLMDTTKTLTQVFKLGDVYFNVFPTGYYCNRFIPSNHGDTEKISITMHIYIAIDKTRADTVTAFKDWLSTNPTYAIYPLATPTETPIVLPTIPTFKGTSIISVDTTIQPSNAEIEYYSNAKER